MSSLAGAQDGIVQAGQAEGSAGEGGVNTTENGGASRGAARKSVCEVAVARPFLNTLAYSIPARLEGAVAPGVRVRVPLGNSAAIGVVDRVAAAGDDRASRLSLRDLNAVLDEAPVVEEALLSLCRWIADYYVAPLGVVLRAALPPGLMTPGRAGRGSAAAPRTERLLRLVGKLPTLTERDQLFGRAKRQREAYETLESIGGEATVRHMTKQLGFSRAVLDGLAAKEVAVYEDRRVEDGAFPGAADPEPRFKPTPGQARVLAALQQLDPLGPAAAGSTATRTTTAPAASAPADARPGALDRASPKAAGSKGTVLLRGVTGSGKTFVYLEAMERQLAEGRSGIILVPEITLTSQIVQRFRARFGDAVALLHSGLSDAERIDAWRQLRAGKKRIAIGPRSTIFAPMRRLGTIVVDEEHDSSYKQSDVPRYHARSVAIMRARTEGCLCILGTATPALESWHSAQDGRYHLLELEERVTPHGLPKVELIDMAATAEDPNATPAGSGMATRDERGGAARDERGGAARDERRASARLESQERAPTAGGNGAHRRPPADPRAPRLFSTRLRNAISRRLERGEQTILFLNRRGYASFAECTSCGRVWRCDSCSVTLTFHRNRRRLVCHHCGFEAIPPDKCDECDEPSPRFTGVGTEQVERRTGELFPEARIVRLDLDTAGPRWAHAKIIDAFRRREADILLGTQMIAKGLDFPGVTLVGVINADVSLHFPDFRASERTFQLLEQVAGRAGRGDEPGEALVQTLCPRHHALAAAAVHDYKGFAEREIEDRRGTGYPPHRRLAKLVVSGTGEARVAEAAAGLADRTRALVRDHRLKAIDVTGPAPCPIERLRGRWRWHLLLRADRAATLGGVLRHLGKSRGGLPSGTRIEIDRDPEAML